MYTNISKGACILYHIILFSKDNDHKNRHGKILNFVSSYTWIEESFEFGIICFMDCVLYCPENP